MLIGGKEVTAMELDDFHSILFYLKRDGATDLCPFGTRGCGELRLCSEFVPDLTDQRCCPCNSNSSTAQLIRIVTMILRQNGRKVL